LNDNISYAIMIMR